MLTHPTVDKLMALRLPAFAEACQRQLGNPEFTALSFEDRLGLLVDAQWTHREQRKLRRRLRHANLRRQASLEDIEVLEDRAERAATLITSQVPVKEWHALIDEPTHADAICDRLIHTAYVIELQGPSLRETRARAQQDNPRGGDADPPPTAAPKSAGPRKRP